jgi:hypothetical protein
LFARCLTINAATATVAFAAKDFVAKEVWLYDEYKISPKRLQKITKFCKI